MNSLKPLIKKAVAEGIIAQANRHSYKRDAAGAGVIFMAGLIALAALGFLIASVYTVLLLIYPVQIAAALTGAGLLILSGLIFWSGARLMQQKRREDETVTRERIESLVDVMADNVTEEMSEPVRDNPKTAMAAAAIAGFLAGDRLR
jgi:hypothetical protein